MKNEEDIKANIEVVTDLATYLENALGEYCAQHKEIRQIDVFMGAHSFHKLIVRSMAILWGAEGMNQNQIYRMADMTFRKAMRELRK